MKGDARIAQVDVSTNAFDRYQPADARFVLEIDPHAYRPERCLALLAAGLKRLEELEFEPELVLYNAGMDPYDRLTPDAGRREEAVFAMLRSAGFPVAFVLAGGYVGPELDQAGLVALHRFTIEAAARAW